MSVWIAAEFEWKPQDTALVDQVVEIKKTPSKGPCCIGQIEIEMTLTKRRTPRFCQGAGARYSGINESCLTDDAFLPKKYNITLETGSFLAPWDINGQWEAEYPRYALRLRFDKSPYPPLPEWKRPDLGPDANKFWEWKEFVGRESAELKKQASSKRSYCAVS